jgi:hypothetical protein
MQKVILPLILVVVLVLGAFGYFMYQDGTFDSFLTQRSGLVPEEVTPEAREVDMTEGKKTANVTTTATTNTTIMANQNTPEAEALIKEARSYGEQLRALYMGGGEMTDAKQAEADALEEKYTAISKQLKAMETDGVEIGISSSLYGYEVTVSLNGTVLPSFKKDSSTIGRYYSANHYMSDLMPSEMSGEHSILLVGENTLTITYKKVGNETADMTLEVVAYEPPFTLLDVAVTGDAGTIEKKFTVQPSKPADATTITVTE